MFAITTAEYTAEGTANILVNRYTPLRRCICIFLSDNGPHFFAQLATAVHKILGLYKRTTSTYYPSGNSCVEHVNHAVVLHAIIYNEHKIDWDVQLPHVEYPYNNFASAAFVLPFSIDHTPALIRAWTATSSPITTSPASTSDSPTNLCENKHTLTIARVNGRNSHLRRLFPPPQIRRWWMGFGLHNHRYYPTRIVEKRKQYSPQKVSFTELDRTLQAFFRWSLLRGGHNWRPLTWR